MQTTVPHLWLHHHPPRKAAKTGRLRICILGLSLNDALGELATAVALVQNEGGRLDALAYHLSHIDPRKRAVVLAERYVPSI